MRLYTLGIVQLNTSAGRTGGPFAVRWKRHDISMKELNLDGKFEVPEVW